MRGRARVSPPDTTTPRDSARRLSPTAGSSVDIKGQAQPNDSGATNVDGKSAPHKKHAKKDQPQPKPADNDNNARPNTISPSSTPSPQ